MSFGNKNKLEDKRTIKQIVLSCEDLLYYAIIAILGLFLVFFFAISARLDKFEKYLENNSVKAYSQQIEIEPYADITDLTGTTWNFNSTLVFNDNDGATDRYYINFVSNDTAYTSIGLNHSTFGGSQSLLLYDYTTAYQEPSMGAPWENDNYKTITITGGSDVENQTLIDWLQQNATLYVIPSLSTPTLYYDFSFSQGVILDWNFVVRPGLTQNFEIYKDNELFTTTSNHTYSITENGTYQLKQKSNLSDYSDSNLSNSVVISDLYHIVYDLPANTTCRTYYSSTQSTNLLDFYFLLNSDFNAYVLFEIDNNNEFNGFVFKGSNDYILTGTAEINSNLINNQSLKLDFNSISSDIEISVKNYSAYNIVNTWIYDNQISNSQLAVGDYILKNRAFSSNEKEFNSIFVNNFNYLVYDFNNQAEDLTYFLSNLTGQYISNSTYNYYLITIETQTDNNALIQDYLASDNVFFDYYRTAVASDFENIKSLNDKLVTLNENTTFISLVGAIIDSHFNTLKSLLNFNLFGISLWSIFTLFFTLTSIYFLFKFIRGGRSNDS